MIDPLTNLLGYELRRASAVMMADLVTELAPLQLKPTEASVLLTIAANSDATQSKVGRILGVQRANMAPIVAMLIGRHLLVRSACDGRSQALRLSTEGEALAAKARDAIVSHEAKFLPHLSEQDRSVLLNCLRALRLRQDDFSRGFTSGESAADEQKREIACVSSP